VGGFELPRGARLELQKRETVQYSAFDFVPIADVATGSGAVFAHTLAIEGHPDFYYLEGCFHLYTPRDAPFPGIVLATGMEDYYDSSFYFHSGAFQLPSSGVTHICTPHNVPPHPACADDSANTSEFSAYRFHDKDPLFFQDGVKLVVRNGDVDEPIAGGPKGYNGKCYNLDRPANYTLNPGKSVMSSIAWIYRW
jgi:hypothetical protein